MAKSAQVRRMTQRSHTRISNMTAHTQRVTRRATPAAGRDPTRARAAQVSHFLVTHSECARTHAHVQALCI